MLNRRFFQGIGIGFIGLALALAPLTAAGASHKSKHHKSHHTTKKVTTAKFCGAAKSEETSNSSIGTAIEQAIESGNYASARTAMLNAFATDTKYATAAESLLSGAPSNVQSAMKNLVSAIGTIKSDIANSTSFAGLATTMESLGQNKQLEADGVTLANYFKGKGCGYFTPTTAPTPSIP
jgi:hypothetical protein